MLQRILIPDVDFYYYLDYKTTSVGKQLGKELLKWHFFIDKINSSHLVKLDKVNKEDYNMIIDKEDISLILEQEGYGI